MDDWQYHNRKMIELKKLYNKTSKQTQNKLQEIFDTFNFTFDNVYNIADKKTKNRVNTYIEEWKDKGLLVNYFGTLAKNIYGRSRVKNSEILELLIYGAYIEEQSKIQEQELNIMYDDVNYYYEQGQQEVNNALPKKERKPIDILKWALFLALLDQPNAKGYVYEQYIQATIQFNAQQIYRQAIIDLQQQNKPDITNDIYQNLLKKQGNTRLNIIDGKATSGDIDVTLIGLNNMAKVEGIKLLDKDAECLFISDLCEHVTQMCSNMNGYKFKVSGWNSFGRWYGETAKDLRIERVKVKGLVLGINLPPITHHFHYCHSTIMYLPVESREETEYNIDNFLRTELYNNKDYKNYIKDYEKVRTEYDRLPDNMKKRLFEKEGVKVVFNYNGKHSGYNYTTKEILLNPNLEDGEFTHEVGHALEYSLDLRRNKKYIEISNKLFDNNFKEPKFDKDEIYYGLEETSEFISQYQSYLEIKYDEIIQNYNNKFLRELISESYRDIYSENSTLKNVNKELYDFIKEIERNA